MRGDNNAYVIHVGWIPGYFNLAYLFKKTNMPGYISHNLVKLMLLNKSSPIGGIDKA